MPEHGVSRAQVQDLHLHKTKATLAHKVCRRCSAAKIAQAILRITYRRDKLFYLCIYHYYVLLLQAIFYVLCIYGFYNVFDNSA